MSPIFRPKMAPWTMMVRRASVEHQVVLSAAAAMPLAYTIGSAMQLARMIDERCATV